MDLKLWHYFYWKEWHERKFREFITDRDIKGKAVIQHYPSVFKISKEDGDVFEFPIPNTDHQKIIFIEKGRDKYMLPVIFETDFPIKAKVTFECLIKKSDKTVYKFVKEIVSIKIPADSYGTSFRQFVDEFNPVRHSNPKHWTLMKLLAIASKAKGIGLCACSTPAFGKNANFTLLKYLLTRICTHKAPSTAVLYQSILTNDVIIFDEFTTTKKETLLEIENTVLGLKDSTPELPKEAMTIGNQKAAADLVNKSIIFTYNRITDLGKNAVFLDNKWNNPTAFRSRYPQFLFEGRVLDTMKNPTKHQVSENVTKYDDEFKKVATQASYWTQNLHTQLKGFSRKLLGLVERHETNAEGWIDAIEAYCETQAEFDDYLIELNSMRNNYARMLKGFEDEPLRELVEVQEQPTVTHITPDGKVIQRLPRSQQTIAE